MSFSSLAGDVRHALRLYRTKPGFAAAALLALTIGIGGCGVILALAEVLLLRPVPYPHPAELALVYEQNLAKGFPSMSSSPADFADDRAEAHAFRYLGAYHRTAVTLLTARLRPWVARARAGRAMDAVTARRERQFPVAAGWSTVVKSLPEALAAPLRPAVPVLLAGGGLPLVIACGNVANLRHARAAG